MIQTNPKIYSIGEIQDFKQVIEHFIQISSMQDLVSSTQHFDAFAPDVFLVATVEGFLEVTECAIYRQMKILTLFQDDLQCVYLVQLFRKPACL
jgi:hypothetical protein